MKNSLIERIQSKKLHCIIISPHFDDAVLSCGALMAKLVGNVDITVINVFTKAHRGPYTLSAKVFMKTSTGFTDATKLYKERNNEDAKVLSQLGIKSSNLGFEDALFRRKKTKKYLGKYIPEFDHVYPTYRWHINKRIAASDFAFDLLAKKLKKFQNEKYLIFAPYGLGNHADHVLVRRVCEKLFSNLILYSDFPYNQGLKTYGKKLPHGGEYRIKPVMAKKTKLIQGYKTQFYGLFPNKTVNKHAEVYFSNKKI